MQYITLQEYNKKENETFVFFLQYTGNEKEINKLVYYIKNANTDDLNGDFSIFSIDENNMISESAVKELIKVDLGSYSSLFNMCKGKFYFDETLFTSISKDDWGLKLDNLYYPCRISTYFKNE